ncbi:MAG: HAMP domain-containing histidine kinase [Clostridiaceae bacterium]|nr:HAMP domain-containing histidine kinase [Clostridiaceae bacterium]
MIGKIYNKIAFKLISLVLFGLLVSTMLFSYLGSKLIHLLLEQTNEISGTQVVNIFNIYSAVIIITPIVAFISIFLLGINQKVKYLKYITNSVRGVKDEVYLEELSLKGNDEITELAKSINIMSSRLKENHEEEKKIEQVKNDLIVAVSHDLKTPLTSIIGYLELLNQNTDAYREKDREYLNIVYEKSISLKKLINELFEYTKLTNDYIVLEKVHFNIAILVNQVVGEYMHFLKEKNISVEIESQSQELWCEIDVQRIMRVLDNIIKNAEKYSFENTKLKISMLEVENNIKITFQNVGEHIKKEELEKIFYKMYRLDKARSLENEGSGLGLAISKKIVELHGGKLWADCEGNTIKFHIILQKA